MDDTEQHARMLRLLAEQRQRHLLPRYLEFLSNVVARPVSANELLPLAETKRLRELALTGLEAARDAGTFACLSIPEPGGIKKAQAVLRVSCEQFLDSTLFCFFSLSDDVGAFPMRVDEVVSGIERIVSKNQEYVTAVMDDGASGLIIELVEEPRDYELRIEVESWGSLAVAADRDGDGVGVR